MQEIESPLGSEADALAGRARLLRVDRSPVVGAELGPGPRPAIEAALDAARIERWLGTEVQRIEPGLQGRLPVDVDACVLATVMRAAPSVFVAGDAAAADTGGGRLSLQSCQHALRMGRFAGENAASDLLGQPLLPYGQERYATCLDLGRAGAVFTEGWDRVPLLTGAAASAVKWRINAKEIVPPASASTEVLLMMSRVDAAPVAA